jgi:hypothetical protein
MKSITEIINYFFEFFLSEKTKKKCEKTIVYIAIISFIVHLLVIALVNLNVIDINDPSKLLVNPIAAIYTPFSFIIVYEVYLLIYYLPKSTSVYIGKQYEIISLIIIRRIFKDLSNIELTTDWFLVKNDIQFTYDIVAIVILFYMIYYFYKLVKINTQAAEEPKKSEIIGFINLKKIIAVCLIPILFAMSIFSLSHWIYENFFSISKLIKELKDINNIFFENFFTVLILVDVLILIYSFLYSDKFYKVIRNSGFIISTVLIKISFSTTGLINTILIVVAVLFGVVIFKIHNLYNKDEVAK